MNNIPASIKQTNIRDLNDPGFVTELLLDITAATSYEQLTNCCTQIQASLGKTELSLYLWHPKRQQFQPLFCGFPRSHANLRSRRLDTEHPLAKRVVASKANHFHSLASTRYFMPIAKGKKLTGFVVLNNCDEPEAKQLRDSLKTLGYCAIQAYWHTDDIFFANSQTDIQEKLIENSDESFAAWNANSGWHFYNQPLPYRLGYTPEQLPIDNIFGHPAMMDEAEWQRCQQALSSCLQKGIHTSILYKIITPESETRVIHTKLRVIHKDPDGKTQDLVAVSVDITEARMFVESVKENAKLDAWLLKFNSQIYNEFSEKIVNKALGTIGKKFQLDRVYLRKYDTEGQGHIIYEWCDKGINSVAKKLPVMPALTIAPHQTFIIEEGRNPVLPEDIRNYIQASDVKSQIIRPLHVENKQIGHMVFQVIEPSRFSRLTKRASRAIVDSFSMVLAQADIRQRLDSSRQQYQMALEASSYGIWEMDLRDRSIYLSPNYFAMIGHKIPANIRFVPISDKNIHIDDRDKVMNLVQELAAGKVVEFSEEARHLTAEGDVIWILMRGKVIKHDDRGHPLRAMGTVVDISDFKRTQTDLEIAHQQALAAKEAKGEFLARMSHEIRTPMNAVIGLTYLARQTKLDEQQQDYIADIDQAAKSLLEIIDNILDFSKIEAGKLQLEPHCFDLKQHLMEVVEELSPMAKAKGLDFETYFDPSAPQHVIADSTRICQVISGLLNNAIKFTEHGKITITSQVLDSSQDDLALRFTITDTGIGISETDVQHLLEAFTQADGSSSRSYGGTGLGLTIAKYLIEMMGGELQIDSQQHKGTRCQFTIHCAFAERPTTKSSDNASFYNPLRGKHVLLVEDNLVNQRVARAILERHGLQVTTADHGQEALGLLSATAAPDFDIVLMDIEMPEMDGMVATAAIRQLPDKQQLPIIGMTAHAVDGNKHVYLSAGMSDCISKPISPTGIYSLLEQHLSPGD